MFSTTETAESMLFFPERTLGEGDIDTDFYLGLENDLEVLADRLRQGFCRDEQAGELLRILEKQILLKLNKNDREWILNLFDNFHTVAEKLTQPLIDLIKTHSGNKTLFVSLERDGQLLRLMVDAIVSHFELEGVATLPFFASRSFFEETLVESKSHEEALARLGAYCQPITDVLERGGQVEILDTGYNGTVVVQLEEYLLMLRSQDLIDQLLIQSVQKIREEHYQTIIVSGTHPQYLARRLEDVTQQDGLELTILVDTTNRSYVGSPDKMEASHGAGLVAKSMRDKKQAHDISDKVLVVDTNSRYQTSYSDWKAVFDNMFVKTEFELVKITTPVQLPQLQSSMVLAYPSRIKQLLDSSDSQSFELMSHLESASHLIRSIDKLDVFNQPHLVLNSFIDDEAALSKFFAFFIAIRVGLIVGVKEELVRLSRF